MRTPLQQLVLSLSVLAALGCGGGHDGGPPEASTIDFSQSSLSLVEGTPETLTVMLATAPSANVTVALSSAGRVTMLPTTLNFTPANFATPQTVVVTPIQDIDMVAGTDIVTATAPGLVTVKVPVVIADDDSQAIVLAQDSIALTEGDSVTVQVRLAFQPASTVTVDLSSNYPTAALPSLSSVQFTPANYATYRSLKVVALQDSGVVPDTVTIRFRAAGMSDRNLIAFVTDNDVQAIATSTDTLFVTEGQTAQFTVKLAFQPSHLVQVDLGEFNTLVATVSPATSVVFNDLNWSTAVTLTVTGTQDANTTTDTTSIRLRSTLAGIADHFVVVIVADND